MSTSDSKITVRKNNGDVEDYNYDKVLASIMKAGVPLKESEAISQRVDKWVRENIKDGTIASTMIRDKIIELMSEQFPSEADSYQAYVKG